MCEHPVCYGSPRLEPIDDKIVDHSTALYPRHNVFTHMGCVLLRTTIGLTLMRHNLSPTIRMTIIQIIVIVIILFGYKYITHTVNQVQTWKVYPRMLITYLSALYLINRHDEQSAGVLIIVDALMGLQSRHMASVLTCGVHM